MVNVGVGVLIMLEGFFGLSTVFMVLGCLTALLYVVCGMGVFVVACLWFCIKAYKVLALDYVDIGYVIVVYCLGGVVC